MKSMTRVPLIALVLFISSQIQANAGAEDSAAICSGCHGEDGTPTDNNFPIIWGQNKGYLEKQLRDFKSGARKNETMSDIAAVLDDQTVQELAAYFAAKRAPGLTKP